MTTTQSMMEVLRLGSDQVDRLWALCEFRPEFWVWFLQRSVTQQLGKWASHYQSSDIAAVWQARPSVPRRPGHLVVPVVPRMVASDPLRWNLAAPSFGLPIQWTRDGHGSGMPHELLDTADSVRKRLGQSARLAEQGTLRGIESSGIAWSAGWTNVDLSELRLEPESAWAPLSVGLVSLLRERPMSNELFVSGYWDESRGRWRLSYETLTRKLETALDWGRRHFAIPADCEPTITKALADRRITDATIVNLRDDTMDLAEAVRPALSAAGLEPKESRRARTNWYLDCPTTQLARSYYEGFLLDEIVEQLQEAAWYKSHRQLFETRPESFVSVVSNSPELIKLSVRLFRPRNCHLIYTSDDQGVMKKYFDDIESWINTRNSLPGAAITRVIPHAVDDGIDHLSALAGIVADLHRESSDSFVLIDMTPGRRPMSLSLLEGGKKGDRVLCWWTDTDRFTRRALPFSEIPLLWELSADRTLTSLLHGRGPFS